MKNISTIVLDLDLTLLNTCGDIENAFNDICNLKQKDRNQLYSIEVGSSNKPYQTINMRGVLRPYIYVFLDFCFGNFDNVVVWSAGSRSYVEKLVEKIFSKTHSPSLVLTRDDLEGEIEYHKKPLKIVAKYLGLKNTDNIVIVDDNCSATRMDNYNCITIPPFSGKTVQDLLDNNDEELLKVIDFLTMLLKKGYLLIGDHILDLYPDRSLARLRNESYRDSII